MREGGGGGGGDKDTDFSFYTDSGFPLWPAAREGCGTHENNVDVWPAVGGDEVRCPPHNMDCDPTRWPESPRDL